MQLLSDLNPTVPSPEIIRETRRVTATREGMPAFEDMVKREGWEIDGHTVTGTRSDPWYNFGLSRTTVR